MTDATATPIPAQPATGKSLLGQDDRTRRRNAAEKRFRAYGIVAISIGMGFLIWLLASIVINGIPAFTQTFINVDITLDEERLDPNGNRNPDDLRKVSTFGYNPLIQEALVAKTADIETEVADNDLTKIISASAGAILRNYVLANPEQIGETIEFRLLASSRVDGYMKGRVVREDLERDRNLDAAHLDLIDVMVERGSVERVFNWDFILGSDASESRPEQAGIGVSMLGSFFMMLVVLLLALPIGVAASIYLEEFAPQNRFTDFI
jgi:phosphate transport system permease protein